MKVFGGGTVIEGHTMILRRFVRRIQKKNHPRKPRSCRAFVRLLSAV